MISIDNWKYTTAVDFVFGVFNVLMFPIRKRYQLFHYFGNNLCNSKCINGTSMIHFGFSYVPINKVASFIVSLILEGKSTCPGTDLTIRIN
jgi:hypothetical protein